VKVYLAQYGVGVQDGLDLSILLDLVQGDFSQEPDRLKPKSSVGLAFIGEDGEFLGVTK
jgi:hypothetical protein